MSEADNPYWQMVLAHINKMYAQAQSNSRTKNDINWYNPPKKWSKTVYIFAWTPWRTRDPKTGKTGFFTLKYRVYKDGKWKLVKSVRFGRRKIAKQRAGKWYDDYYEQ